MLVVLIMLFTTAADKACQGSDNDGSSKEPSDSSHGCGSQRLRGDNYGKARTVAADAKAKRRHTERKCLLFGIGVAVKCSDGNIYPPGGLQ
eukprot:5353580-Pleurochrysis_carterae.AAC.1